MGEMMIDGVSLHPLRQISVPNGDLWHALKATDDGFVGFGEAYFTQIEMRLLTTGTPKSRPISSPVFTRFFAMRVSLL